MKIRTKSNVTYNKPITGTSDGVVIGIINNASWVDDFNRLGVNYQYADINGNVFHTSSFTIDGYQIDAMYEAIKDSIPTEGTYRDIERAKFYLGFIFQMAATFEIEIDEIEIVA